MATKITPAMRKRLEQVRRGGLEPAFEVMRKDAERYRWLRNSALLIDQAGAFSPYVIQGQTLRPLDGAPLDRLVDLAMKAPNAKVKGASDDQ